MGNFGWYGQWRRLGLGGRHTTFPPSASPSPLLRPPVHITGSTGAGSFKARCSPVRVRPRSVLVLLRRPSVVRSPVPITTPPVSRAGGLAERNWRNEPDDATKAPPSSPSLLPPSWKSGSRARGSTRVRSGPVAFTGFRLLPFASSERGMVT